MLGFVGIDGSPSCGVDYTCRGNWLGSFGCRTDLEETLADCHMKKKPGVMMSVLQEMLVEESLADRIIITSLYAPEPEKCMNLIDNNKIV